MTAAVARRYARALLDVALEQGDAPSLRRELEGAARTIQDHAGLGSLLTHPAVSPDVKKKTVDAVFAGSAPLLLRLLRLLVDRRRIDQLPEIARAYTLALQAHQQVVPAEVVSAAPLEAAQVEQLARALKTLTGCAVEITPCVDPAVLGGVLVRIQGRTYDGSVRARLRSLRERLVGA